MIRDWVHGMGHSPVCQTLLQILCKALITASPPACNSSSGILSIPGDFPFLSDFTVASTSSCKIVVSVGNQWDSQHVRVTYDCVAVQFRTVFCPPVQNVVGFSEANPVFVLYGVGFSLFCASQSFNQLICLLTIVLPGVIFNILTLYINPDSFAFFILFLISWLIALYLPTPSAVSCLPFSSAPRSSHAGSDSRSFDCSAFA